MSTGTDSRQPQLTDTTADALGIRTLDVPGYECVRLAEDPESGLRAIVAIHDTTLGPALGGTRFYPYSDDDAALTDVKRLAEGMTWKSAAAALDLGGGKAVIIGDPATAKTPELLRAYGRFVDSFQGLYITAADVGTSSEDLDIVGQTTPHVVGRTSRSGDSGYSTALGVFASMRASVRFLTGRHTLTRVRVGVEGAGKVGYQLIGILQRAGAEVIATDVSALACERLAAAYPGVTIVDNVLEAKIDVYAPCALGASLDDEAVSSLTSYLVCGAANNQLASEGTEEALAKRHIRWVPDYVANAGGLIQVDAERTGRSIGQARADIRKLDSTVTQIFRRAFDGGVTTGAAARQIVEERLASRR